MLLALSCVLLNLPPVQDKISAKKKKKKKKKKKVTAVEPFIEPGTEPKSHEYFLKCYLANSHLYLALSVDGRSCSI